MTEIDRGRIAELMEREQSAIRGRPSRLPPAARARRGLAALRRADELDDPLAGRVPGLPRVRRGSRGHRRRRQRLRRPLPRRHRGDDRPLAGRPRSQRSSARAERGITAMLPTEDAVLVGEEMKRRFGLPDWQFTLSATDANRFVVRLAREITGRPKILVHNHCYHGSVDETVAGLVDGEVQAARGQRRAAGRRRPRRPGSSRSTTSRRLERELSHGDVACVLVEPALTNIGIVLAEDGYHERLRELTRETEHAAGDRRDPHAVLRARRLHRRGGPRARLPDDRQADRRRRADRRLRVHRRGRRADPRAHRRRGGRRRRGRWDAGRQRAVARRGAGRRSPRC